MQPGWRGCGFSPPTARSTPCFWRCSSSCNSRGCGLWLLARDRPVDPMFLALLVVLQIARLWVLTTLGRRWSIRVIVIPGEKLLARGPYRLMRHPNYAVVTGEL